MKILSVVVDELPYDCIDCEQHGLDTSTGIPVCVLTGNSLKDIEDGFIDKNCPLVKSIN